MGIRAAARAVWWPARTRTRARSGAARCSAIPVKLMPSGAGLAANPSGNGGVGAFGTNPNGTITVGYPGFAATAAPVDPANNRASSRSRFMMASMPSAAAQPQVLCAVGHVARAIGVQIHLVRVVELCLAILDRAGRLMCDDSTVAARSASSPAPSRPSEASHALKSRFIPYLNTIEHAVSCPFRCVGPAADGPERLVRVRPPDRRPSRPAASIPQSPQPPPRRGSTSS